MDTVREEDGEEEEDDAEDPEDNSAGEWGQNGVFQTVSVYEDKITVITFNLKKYLSSVFLLF